MVDPCDYAVKMINRGGDLEDRPRPLSSLVSMTHDRHNTELACFSTASMASNLQVTHSGDDKVTYTKVLLHGGYL